MGIGQGATPTWLPPPGGTLHAVCPAASVTPAYYTACQLSYISPSS